MHVEIAHKGKHIITLGDVGMTFYVVLQGIADVYVPFTDSFNFTQKEYLEFVLPKREFIKTVNNDSDLKLPDYIDILEFDDNGKI